MRANRRVLLLLPLLLGMRDPFKAPESRCPDAMLSQWRYAGVVLGAVPVGLIRDDQARWLRVHPGDVLAQGLRVMALDENELVIDTQAVCDAPLWRWQRQGIKQDENRDRGTAVDRQSGAGSGTGSSKSDRG